MGRTCIEVGVTRGGLASAASDDGDTTNTECALSPRQIPPANNAVGMTFYLGPCWSQFVTFASGRHSNAVAVESKRRTAQMNFTARLVATAAAAAFVISGATVASFAQGAAPSDPQIVGIVVTANQIDIDTAKLALQKTKNQQVHDFAQQMIDDHSALQNSVKDLGSKLHVTPADSDTSKSLKQQAAQETSKLKGLSGSAFDKEYIDHEVGYHKAVINAASNVLIPNAKNAELKSALEGAAPLFQGHLEHAEQVQASLNGGASGTSAAGGHKH
jgi:putative membrane protein